MLILHCDRILVLEAGDVVEFDTPVVSVPKPIATRTEIDSLMGNPNGKFRSMMSEGH